MNPIIKNVLAVVAGAVIGSIVNMSLITLGGQLIPPPEGVDVTSMESLKASMHLFETKHFIFPFLAHALGTFIGAMVAFKIGASHQMKLALGIGAFFLIAGIANIMMLPSPIWFNVLDIVGAYIPMAWLGGQLMQRP